MDILDQYPEAVDDLRLYADLLRKWSKRINLIAPSTLDLIWDRHIADSAQLYGLIPGGARTLVDLGSGGGLPVVVLAILAKSTQASLACTAVESDQRKCAFLRTVNREIGLDLKVMSQRIEDLALDGTDVVTARALAPVSQLLSYAEPLRVASGTCLFLKGESVQKEVSEALNSWHFEPKYHRSVTSPSSAVLEIGDFSLV